MKKLSLKQKFITTCIALVAMPLITIYLVVYFSTSRSMNYMLQDNLNSYLDLGYRYFDASIPGEWSIRNNQLYKGNTLINGNFDLVDELLQSTGAAFTIFQHDIIVSTNVTTADGTRAVGTRIAPEVAERVLNRGMAFEGEADVAGTRYLTSYIPIKDADNNNIGIWFCGITQENVLQQRRTITGTITILTILFIISAGFISVLISNSIAKPVSMNIESLDAIINTLLTGSEEVNNAAMQVSQSSQVMAEGAAEQTASIEETSAAIEEMSYMAMQNLDNSKHARNLMAETKSIVVEANASMKKMTTSMEEVAIASDNTSKIIKTIDEIAFQTNLLALNAAVEAARAGEAGAGFAVVADEVRNLAMRSAEAAKDTAVLIESTVKKVYSGRELANNTNDIFSKVDDSANKIAGLIDEIAAASEEQNSGIEMIKKAINELEKVTQQNSSVSEESAAAAEELNAQSSEQKKQSYYIMDILNNLKLIILAKADEINYQNQMLSQQRSNSKSLIVRNKESDIQDVIPSDDDLTDF